VRSPPLRSVLTCIAFAIALVAPRLSRALEPEAQDPGALFREATEALAAERVGDAVAKLEALGDRGVVDAVVSFDRGIAYAARARTSAAQAGDLGRAVHGFEEARELSRDTRLDDDAKRALASLRSEIARRRARAGESAELAIGASLGRALVELASENTWAALAAAASVVLSLAILARSRATRGRAKVAANTTMGIASAVLVAAALLANGAREVRLHVREAVVVTPGTRLLDARKIVLAGRDPLAEGARVTLLEEEGGFSHIRAGALEGWVSQAAVLPLAKRR
jgi:hypothetical protein